MPGEKLMDRVLGLTRRLVLALVASSPMALGFVAARAQEEKSVTKAASWLLGSKLSLGLLLKSRGGEELGNKMLTQAETFAQMLGLQITPFAPTGKTDSEILAETTHYLIKGDGAQLGAALSSKFDESHGILFEIAIKSNLAILLYIPGDDFGLAGIIQDRCTRINLPEELWTPVVNAMQQKQDQDTVKSLIFKMHDDVARYLAPA
jgi:hypothetical protein